MSKIKALTLNEIKNMDGQTVFIVPVVYEGCEEPHPSLNTLYSGLGTHIIKKSEGLLVGNDGCFWRFDDINPSDIGFIAFREPVTKEEANKAWEELKLNGMVK